MVKQSKECLIDVMSDAEELCESLAGIAGALANPRRLRALNLLFQGPKAIETLAGLLGESEANTAAHMKVLRAAGLVTAKRDGKYLLQEPVMPAALQLFLTLRASGEALSPAIRPKKCDSSIRKQAKKIQK